MQTKVRGRFALLVLAACAFSAPLVYGEVIDKDKQKKDKEKEKPTGRDHDETGLLNMTWYQSVQQVVDYAKANYVPAMVLIYRDGNADDLRRIKNVESWPSVIEISHTQMAAVKISDQSDEAKTLID